MSIPKFFLSVAIAIIFAIFIAYGLFTIYPAPKYDYYTAPQNTCHKTHNCSEQLSSCTEQFDRSSDSEYFDKYRDCQTEIAQTTEYQTCLEARKACDLAFTKQTEQYAHDRNNFFILMGIGVFAVIIGMLLIRLETVGSGFVGGGVILTVWSLVYTRGYWRTLHDAVQLVPIGIVLVILVYLAYKKLDKQKPQAQIKNF